MTDANISIGIRGDDAGARRVQRSLDNVSESANKAETSTDRLSDSVENTSSSFFNLNNAVRAVAGSLALREFIRAVDSFSLLEARIRNATDSTEEFEEAFQSLQQTAIDTGTEFATTVDVFQRIDTVRDQIGATNSEILQFTETVSQLGVISGASTGALNAALLQLGQGLGEGILRAEEFNSVLSNTPQIAQAIADQFGVNTSELRNLVLEGEVLSQDVFAAILNQSEQINEQFREFPETVGRAFNNLTIAASQSAAEIDKAAGATQTLINLINTLAEAVAALPRVFELLRQRVDLVFEGISLRVDQLLDLLSFSGTDRSAEFDVRATAFSNRFERVNSELADIFTGAEQVTQELEQQEQTTRELSKNYRELSDSISVSTSETEKLERSTNEVARETRRLEREAERTQERFNQFGDRVGTLFSNFLTGATDARGVLRGLLNDLFRFISIGQGGSGGGNIFGPLFQSVFGGGINSGGIVPGGGGSGFGGIFTSGGIIPGFNNGGSFTVGGRGGVDRNLLSLNGAPVARVSRGEQVNVSPQGGGAIVNQTINLSLGVDTAVAAEVRRVLPDIQRSTVAAVNEARLRGITS